MHFLSNVVASPKGGRIAADNQYRRYRTFVHTSATIGGNIDRRNASIYYEVGRRFGSIDAALAATGDSGHAIEAAYPTNKMVAEDFAGLARKYTNFSATFEYSSLAAVVERVAKGLAAASLFEGVEASSLRGNAALTINGLGTYDGPVNSLTNTVFIPRLVNGVMNNDVFIVLVNAVAGAGASVATDIIELDANTRQPLIADIDGDALPSACADALRLLGSNMIACDQGPLFALAVTRGIHKVVSVVGHTDEGAIMRDLLRAGEFGVPFGGIHYGLEDYSGIPALQWSVPSGVAAFVDSIALTTAALVAHCDPGDKYGGEWFPTIFNGTSSSDTVVRPGVGAEGTQAMADRNRAQLLASSSRMMELYTAGLGKLFNAGGDNSVASRFSFSALYHLGGNNRHLRYPTVTPWYWIEPTSLLPHDMLGSDAETYGSGSLAARNVSRTKAAWEDLSPAGARDTTFSGYHARFLSPRRAWFFAHWLNHPLNGLGAIRLRQIDPNGVVQPGPHNQYPEVRDRLEADEPISSYLWTRGQSPFCAPGEFLNLSGSIGFLVRHLTFEDDGIPTQEHVPSAHEFLDCAVTIEVGRPVGLTNGKSNAGGTGAQRARTRAANELNAAKRRSALFGRSDVAEMPTLSSAPGRSFKPSRDSDKASSGGGAVFNGTEVVNKGPDRATDYERQAEGVARPAVGHYNAQSVPQIKQPGGQGRSAAVRAPVIVPGSADDPDADDRRPIAPVAPDALVVAPAAPHALHEPGAAPPSGPTGQ